MTLVIIHDADKELAALVQPDATYGQVPIMYGPDAADLLAEFVKAMPVDLNELTNSARVELWDSYVKEQSGTTITEQLKAATAAPAATDSPAAPAPGETPAPAAGAAEGTAHDAPADTDPTSAATTASESPPGSSATGAGVGASAPSVDTSSEPAKPPDAAAQPATSEPAPAETKTCPVCDGAGTIKAEPDGAIGQCGYCQGTGKVEVPT